METKTIAKVNNVDIVSTNDEQMVAIKPICEALGIDYKVQWQKIKDDEDLSAQLQPMEKNGKCAVCLSAISLDGYSLSIPQM